MSRTESDAELWAGGEVGIEDNTLIKLPCRCGHRLADHDTGDTPAVIAPCAVCDCANFTDEDE